MTKYDFSAHFLRIIPPDTNFGEAWESLCFDLLDAEKIDPHICRLNAPDCGIDILCSNIKHAFQCKCDERGTMGSLSAEKSIKSLNMAFNNKQKLDWYSYFFCTNANYTGIALTKIKNEINKLGLSHSEVGFLGPEYWDKLCVKYNHLIEDRFYYRITASEKHVMDALKSARYYEKYVIEFSKKIHDANFRLVIKNNRTSLKLVIPFSPDLTVNNCLDIVRELLGISLDKTEFSDLETSARPSLSLIINGEKQSLSKKIIDFNLKSDDEIELWIKIIWQDEFSEQQEVEKNLDFLYYKTEYRREIPKIRIPENEREQLTLQRYEAKIQDKIWNSAINLKTNIL
jgi:hypothetical protein